MALFKDKSYKPKKSDPGPFSSRYLTGAQKTPRYENTTPIFQPTRFDPASSQYGGAQTAGIRAATGILESGGYTPEQTQRISTGFEQALGAEQDEAMRRTKENLAARGLLDSGAGLKALNEVTRTGQLARSQYYSDLAREGAGQVLPALSAVQSGYGLEANIDQAYQNLAASTSLGQADLQNALNQINATLDMSDADREVELTRIANQYNLDRAQLAQAYEFALMERSQASRNRRASLFSNIIGGGLGAAGGIIGGGLQARGLSAIAGALG